MSIDVWFGMFIAIGFVLLLAVIVAIHKVDEE